MIFVTESKKWKWCKSGVTPPSTYYWWISERVCMEEEWVRQSTGSKKKWSECLFTAIFILKGKKCTFYQHQHPHLSSYVRWRFCHAFSLFIVECHLCGIKNKTFNEWDEEWPQKTSCTIQKSYCYLWQNT